MKTAHACLDFEAIAEEAVKLYGSALGAEFLTVVLFRGLRPEPRGRPQRHQPRAEPKERRESRRDPGISNA
jgi:hypothetical protein